MFKEYQSYDAMGLAELVRSGDVSASEVLESAIAQVNQLNPSLNAVIHRFDAKAKAQCDKLPEGPFQGVPFLLKDLTGIVADEPITFGSRGIRYIPNFDSELVKRFRKTGLNFFGKTNTPEMGLIITTDPKAHGPSHNPHKQGYSTGGSSGGSACAVASGMVPIASAGDGGGSIRFPAAWSGCFGLKPSRGLNPLGPDECEGWDGAISEFVVSRSVRDSALMLDQTAGWETGAPYAVDQAAIGSFYEASQADPKPLKIAVSKRSLVPTELDPEVASALDKTIEQLRSLGHEVEEFEPNFDRDIAWFAFFIVVCAHTAAHVKRIGQQFGRDAVRLLEPTTKNMAILGRSASAETMVLAKHEWHHMQMEMGRLFSKYDVMLCPTVPTPAVQHGVLPPSPLEERLLGISNLLPIGKLLLATGAVKPFALPVLEKMGFTILGNVTGLPAMSVPMHSSSAGLPIGMQFYGPMLGEARLLSLAGQVERAGMFQSYTFDK